MKNSKRFIAGFCMMVLVCVVAVLGANGTIAKTLSRAASQYVLNDIAVYAGGSLQETIPASAFSVSVSITSKTGDDTVYVVLAAYDDAGAMVMAKSSSKFIAANQTVSCQFEFANSAGNINSLKAFVLDSAANVLPVAGSISVSNQIVVESAYFDNDDLILSMSDGTQRRVSLGTAETFADYEVGTVFPVEPREEFDWPVVVKGREYTVHIESMYYELAKKNDITDTTAYAYNKKTSTYIYQPYEVKVYINAKTDAELEGSEIGFYFYSPSSTYYYSGIIESGGRVHIVWTQYVTEDTSSSAWIAPKSLMFKQASVTYRCKMHTFKYADGYYHVCTVCKYDEEHTMVDGYCDVCHASCRHSWSKTEETHTCRYCGTTGAHTEPSAENANMVGHYCGVCNYIENHIMSNGVCTVCGYVCKHSWKTTDTTHTCKYCEISGTHVDSDEDKFCDICKRAIV